MDRNAEEKGQAVVLEEGEILFFYHPDSESGATPREAGDARFFMVLHPTGKSRYRLIELGSGRVRSREGSGKRFLASVERVMTSLDELREELIERKGRSGRREKRGQARTLQAGEGIYALLKYGEDTHLIYALDYPLRENAILDAMGVSQEGGYTANVRNPDAAGPHDFSRHPDFPRHLLERFQGREYIPLDPVEFLNEEGAELALTGAGEADSREPGIEFNSRNGSRTHHG